jgi:radical SAM protein with 4Fe4S-binding SPASM domain
MPHNLYSPPYSLKELKIEVTQRCPFNCIHCSSDAHPGQTTEFDFPIILQLLRDAKRLGTEEMVFSGGEPLVWKNILEAIARASELGLKTAIYTTGRTSLENNKNDGKISDDLKKAGLKRAVFSIYGAKKTYEKIVRVAGSYEKTINIIKDFQDNGIDTEIHFVPLKINFRELPEIISLAKSLNIERVSILRFVPHGRGALLGKSLILSKAETLELRKQIKKLRQENPDLQIRLGSPFNFILLEQDVMCKAGIDRLIIGPDGTPYPCDAFKNFQNDSYGVDSVYQKTLKEIWENSQLILETRKYLSSEPYEQCQECVHFKLCKSGCLAQKVIRNCAFNKDKDPDCLAESIG